MGERWRAVGGPLVGARCLVAPRREKGEATRESVGHCRDQRGAEEAQVSGEDPGRQKGPDAGSEHVDGIEHADGSTSAAALDDRGPNEKRQRHPHEDGGRQQRCKLKDASEPRQGVERAQTDVKQVVVQRKRDGAEPRNGELDGCEGEKRSASGEALAQNPGRMTSDAQASHEGGDDHRHRVDPDARVQREDPLPDHLVDEGGDTAQEEGRSGKE